MPLNEKISEELGRLENGSALRKLRTISERSETEININGRIFLNCSSNDYLGIASDQILKNEFFENIKNRFGDSSTDLSSSSSRLLSGNFEIYEKVEKQIAELLGKPAALYFSSGYHMNAGFFPAVYGKGDLIIADKLVHASIIDGIMLSKADYLRYRHLDYAQLEEMLEKNREKYENCVIVTESVFSMDGDISDLKKITDLAKKYQCETYVDEAHAVGCFGDNGAGVCASERTLQDIDFIAGTVGKGLGGAGAFIACGDQIRDYLINRCRSFIFTTALPPINLEWTSFVLSKLPHMKDRREKFRENYQLLRRLLNEKGFETKGNSQIVPIVIGDDEKTLEIADKLLANGIFAPAIRPPTVRKGTSRLRFSVTASFSEDMIRKIADKISEVTG